MALVVKICLLLQEMQVQSLGWEDPLEKKVATHSNILAWRIPWTEQPGGLSQRVRRDWTCTHKEKQTSQVNEFSTFPYMGRCKSLGSLAEKAMAPHSSTLAWKISWAEEPGRLQSMGSRRVGHNWSGLAAGLIKIIPSIGTLTESRILFSSIRNYPQGAQSWWLRWLMAWWPLHLFIGMVGDNTQIFVHRFNEKRIHQPISGWQAL